MFLWDLRIRGTPLTRRLSQLGRAKGRELVFKGGAHEASPYLAVLLYYCDMHRRYTLPRRGSKVSSQLSGTIYSLNGCWLLGHFPMSGTQLERNCIHIQ